MAELILGCNPCENRVIVEGDWIELCETDDIVLSTSRGDFPRALINEEGGGAIIINGLGQCPETGVQCPFGSKISGLVTLALENGLKQVDYRSIETDVLDDFIPIGD